MILPNFHEGKSMGVFETAMGVFYRHSGNRGIYESQQNASHNL